MKRIFDFLISLAGLIIISPVLIVLALLVKATSNGYKRG
jgi:O-antigen biosynthesis protein WbqP